MQEMGDPLAGVDRKPLAGYHGGVFYVRDRWDNFRLYPGGNLHIDGVSYFGPGVSDTALKDSIRVRRLRVQMAGELLNTFQFLVQPEWGSTTLDNPTGTTELYAGKAGQAPTAATARYAAVQGGTLRATLADAYVNYGPCPYVNIQVGQFQAPFTMENRTSSNTSPFLETAMPARALGIPTVRELGAMFWGALDKNLFYYSAGLFLGEGPNRPNVDNRIDTIMRYYTRPLANTDQQLKDLQIGASFRYGMRDKNRVAYDYPGMTTQGDYTFWSPTYTDSLGRYTHVIPSGSQMGIAGELRIPFQQLDFRSEFVYVQNRTREGVDGYQRTYAERLGTLQGYSYYVQLGYWIFGNASILGYPGEARPLKLDLNKPDPASPIHGLEVLVKWEQLHAKYQGADRAGTPDANNIDGDIKVNTISAAATYWGTRHVRVSLNYVLNMFPDSQNPTTNAQRAQAPGNTLDKGVNDDARSSAHLLHELSMRFGVAF